MDLTDTRYSFERMGIRGNSVRACQGCVSSSSRSTANFPSLFSSVSIDADVSCASSKGL